MARYVYKAQEFVGYRYEYAWEPCGNGRLHWLYMATTIRMYRYKDTGEAFESSGANDKVAVGLVRETNGFFQGKTNAYTRSFSPIGKFKCKGIAQGAVERQFMNLDKKLKETQEKNENNDKKSISIDCVYRQ